MKPNPAQTTLLPTPPPHVDHDEHARVRGLLADAGQRELLALRHLFTCPLCWQLARVVLLAIPALELRGAEGGHPRRRQRHQPLRQRS